jgi:hypothetical protein
MIKYILIIPLTIFSVHFLSAQPLPLADYPKMIREGVKNDFSESDIDSLKQIAFKNDNNDVRYRACQLLFVALHKSKNIRKDDIGDLLTRYDEEKEKNIRGEIIKCLWTISYKEKDERILNLAVGIVQAGGEDITRALNIIDNYGGDKRVENDLIELIRKGPDKNYYYQEAAIKCLGKMKSEKAVQVLYDNMIYLLRNKNDKFFNVSTDYQTALIPSPSLGQLYVYLYIGGLSDIGGDKVISMVAPLIDDDDLTIRQNAAMILGYIGDVRSVPVLCEIVINSKDPNMRTCAIYYLSSIGDKKAIPALKKALKDNYMDMSENHPLRYDAYKALQKLGVKVTKGKNDEYIIEE